MLSPKEIIEDIRKNRYGIGHRTDPQSEIIISELKTSLNKALEHLSEDLYSQETHFILEIIQNAEDNEYDAHVTPYLKFVIDNEKILIQNNEKGFSEPNVRAICDVGKTTKAKKFGYIGEKGIGFKSVFRVSDTPQIFSNGFQFVFKRKDLDDKLGFVVPHWIENVPDYIDTQITNIVLPLRDEVKDELSKFNELDPILILFLHKLKNIIISNIYNNDHSEVLLTKKNGKVEISHLKGKEYYILIRKSLNISQEFQGEEEKRKGVEVTELILAFPVKPDGSAYAAKGQKVFAFLPTRGYGFKFIVQADFLVPANREDIHKDKLWNKWLRDSISSVFLIAVDNFKQDEFLKKTYYNFIPLSDKITDNFFSPVVNHIHTDLRESECILTESGGWRRPQDVLTADNEIKYLIPNDDLIRFFNKEYIHSDVKSKQSILDALEVKKFEFTHLVNCLQDTKWLNQKSDEWFIRFYSYMKNQMLEEEQLNTLKGLQILRLENEQMASTMDNPIFSKLDRDNYGFENELRIIKRAIYDPGDKILTENIREFLKLMGVRGANPREIINDHILPIYESKDDSSNWKSKGSKILLGYIRYLKENIEVYERENDKLINASKRSWEEREDSLKRLKNTLLLRINKTINEADYYDHPANIYLPKGYGNSNNLELLFEGINDIAYVHLEYIDDILRKFRSKKRKGEKKKQKARDRREAEVKRWWDFFIKIGVNIGLKVVNVDKSYLTWEDKARLRELSPHKTDYTYESEIDYNLVHLHNILKNIDNKCGTLLAKLVDKQWKDLSNFSDMQYEWTRYGRSYTANADSTWLRMLKVSAWLPTTRGEIAKPTELFIDNPETRKLLGEYVPYLDIEFKNEEIITKLGINKYASVKAVLNYLHSLVLKGYEDKDTFKLLYEFLDKYHHENKEIITDSFSKNPLIYLSETPKKYFTLNEVVWKESSDIFRNNLGYLEKQYPDSKSFFIDVLGVSERPKIKDYAAVLIELSQKDVIHKEDEKIILRVYRELNNQLRTEIDERSIAEEEWWSDFINQPIYWTDKNEFWYNENDVFVNDNRGLYELFKSESKIAFIKIKDDDYPKIQHFLKAAGVSYISKVIFIELLNHEKRILEEELTDQIQKYVRYILRYLYYSAPDNYERMKDDGTFLRLKTLKCYSIDQLEVTYKLNDVFKAAIRTALLYKDSLYIQRTYIDNTDVLAVELSKLFSDIKGIDDFLISLFDRKTEDKIENLLKVKEIRELPGDELRWFGMLPSPGAEEKSGEEEGDSDIVSSEPPLIKPSASEQVGELPSEYPAYSSDENQESSWEAQVTPDEAIKHTETFSATIKYDTALDVKSTENIEYEDKSSKYSSDNKRKLEDALTPAARRQIGKWGEKYVYEWLRRYYIAKYPGKELSDTEDGFKIISDDKTIVEVYWMNKKGESGAHYDIRLVDNGIDTYIEVKSTKSASKEWFEISKDQWGLAEKIQDQFHIYRVFNVGTKEVKSPVEIQNPVKLWREGKLSANPVRIHI